MSSREKFKLDETLQQHLQNGGQLSPLLLRQLGVNSEQSQRDLRRGLLLTAIGVACFVCGFITGSVVMGAVCYREQSIPLRVK
ncbi:hypothetical protein [Pseudidiomarina sp.]|uniref:hypothetical protein n=1 Tax=Pseudidiomarina sp. TaxID=2081707 RepID=UPI003A968E57